MKLNPNRFILFLDVIGTFVFAVEGAIAAIQAQLDLMGVMVLAFATALGGGVIRDMLAAKRLARLALCGARFYRRPTDIPVL
jgi:uncharacterized membrane protein YeiH